MEDAMKNNNNQWERLKIVLALTFFVVSILSFALVQAEEPPCCNKCDPFCEYTAPSEGKGWIECEENREPGQEHCDFEFYGRCI